MKHLKIFEDFNNDKNLIIVDVQKSFSKFFTDNYLKELNKYCKHFDNVYQLWDNHVDGKNVDKDYLYDDNPDIPSHPDLYNFPNQRNLIEKRYNYDVNIDFYKKILNTDIYNEIREKEKNNKLRKGDNFLTTGGTLLVYIGNNHIWHHMSKKLYDIFSKLKGKEVIITGGSSNECLLDVEVCGLAMGVKITRNDKYIYSATHCPIK